MKTKFIIIISKIIVSIFSIAGGITAASAVITLYFLKVGMSNTAYILISILFIATTFINYRLCCFAVPEILISLFGMKRLFQGLIETDAGKKLSLVKKLIMAIGILLALSVGITFGALNYFGSLILIASCNISCVNPRFFPWIVGFFSIGMFICMSSLMLKSIAKLIKTENFIAKCKTIFLSLIDTNPQLPRNQNKTPERIICERIITLILTFIAIPLALTGLFMMMQACHAKLNLFLNEMLQMSPQQAQIISSIISLGFAMVGQIPFVLRTTLLTVGNIFDKKSNAQESENQFGTKNICLLVMRLIYAVGNGFIAMLGAPQGGNLMVLAGIGSMGYSFAAAAYDPPSTAFKSTVLTSPQVRWADN